MLYLDTETTGLTFYDTVVEVAIVDDDGAVLMHTLCNPGFAMSDEVIQIHGITNEMVADAPSSADVIQQVLDICRGQAVCIFNSEFDSMRIPTMAGSQSNRWRAAVPTDRGQLRGSAIRFMPPLTGGCSVAAGSAWFKLAQARPRYQ